MNDRTKSPEHLKKDLALKINGVSSLLEQALKCEYESDERIEYSNIISSSLRAILYGDKENNYQSLIHRVGFDRKLLFPLYNSSACLNIFPTYNLLQFSVSKDGVKVGILEDLFNTGGMWRAYLTFDSWINEVVIDTKLKDVEPISRLLAVKIVADSTGAHVDSKIEEHFYEMSKHELLPVVVIDGVEVQRNLEAKTRSLFCETILAIAKELVDAYETWIGLSPKIIGPSNIVARVQKFAKTKPNYKYELLKYGTVDKNYALETNTYNSNSFYECEVYSRVISNFEVVKGKKLFEFVIIDYTAILDGDYLGKSIYL